MIIGPCSSCGKPTRAPSVADALLCADCRLAPRSLPSPVEVCAVGVSLTVVVLVTAAGLGAIVAHHLYNRLTGAPP